MYHFYTNAQNCAKAVKHYFQENNFVSLLMSMSRLSFMGKLFTGVLVVSRPINKS